VRAINTRLSTTGVGAGRGEGALWAETGGAEEEVEGEDGEAAAGCRLGERDSMKEYSAVSLKEGRRCEEEESLVEVDRGSEELRVEDKGLALKLTTGGGTSSGSVSASSTGDTDEEREGLGVGEEDLSTGGGVGGLLTGPGNSHFSFLMENKWEYEDQGREDNFSQ
jgi:hypothetical protein